MEGRHLDILNSLTEEIVRMKEWVERSGGVVGVERTLTTEEDIIEVEELRSQLKHIFEEVY